MKKVVVSSNGDFIELVRKHKLFVDASIVSPADLAREDVQNAYVASDCLSLSMAEYALAVYTINPRSGKLSWKRVTRFLPPPDRDNRGRWISRNVYKSNVREIIKHDVLYIDERAIVKDFRARSLYNSFCLIAMQDVLAAPDRSFLFGVARLERFGQKFVARGAGGEWDVWVVDVESRYVEPLNEHARQFAIDTNSMGTGEALLAVRPGAVVRIARHRLDAPDRIVWYCGGGRWYEVEGEGTARELGWLNDNETYRRLL